MTISVRPSEADDFSFLEEMMVAASNWDPGRPFQPLERLLQDEHMRRYLQGWGRVGDVAFIAEEEGQSVGATWRRFYPRAEPGYGFVAETIPEVSIAVMDGRRGRGVGAALLDALADDARRSGLAALSLSVEVGNPALRLYLRQGYAVIRSTDEDHVLRLDLQ